MKCLNCTCQVSPDFKYAFATNCCPKCGDMLMPVSAQSLYMKMQDVLGKDNNDIGDLAIWLINSYLPNITNSDEVSLDNSVQDEEQISYEAPEELADVIQELKPKKPTPIKTSKEQKLLNPDRANIFAKRAGVDKIKFETLVKDIQGSDMSSEPVENTDYEDTGDDYDADETPLSRYEMQQVAGLFEASESGKTDFSEIEKLHKLEQLASTGSVGKIKRS